MKKEVKENLVIDAVKARTKIITSMGYASAAGYGVTIAGLIISLGAYLFNKDLNGLAIWGMFGVGILTLITASCCAHYTLEG